VVLYGGSVALWVVEGQWFGSSGCAPQQAIIAITIIFTIALTIISCTKIAPHGTLLTSAVVTAYASYQSYSALSSHPDAACNATQHAPDLLFGGFVFLVAMASMAASAWSATSSKDALIGKSSTHNSDLQVTLEAGAGASDAATSDEEVAVEPESWWYYHLSMVVVSLYFAMLISHWSVAEIDEALGHSDMKSLSSFWVKISAQWVTLLMYGWTLLAPYLLRDVRDFGIEFDF